MTVKYDGKGKKKRKGGRRRYRDNNKIEALHSLYKPKDYDDERGYHDDNWEHMEEK